MNPRLLLPVAGLLLASCSTPQWENQWGVRGSVAVVDEYDLDAGGSDADTDYQSVRGGIYVRHVDRDGTPIASTEYLYGSAEFGSIETTELAFGARYYVYAAEHMRPFVGLYTVWTDFEDQGGVDFGSQVSIGPALGIEVPLTGMFWLDATVDYQIPVIAAEDDAFPMVEREVGGLSIFVGVGLDF